MNIPTQTIILAADHAGFELKEAIKRFLQNGGYTILDVGAHELVPGDDYPEYMIAAAMKVAADIKGETKAILFGKSGQGEAMVANRFPGVRAAVWYGNTAKMIDQKEVRNRDAAQKSDIDIIKLSREHNDANVLSIGAGFVSEDEAKKAVETWLITPFSNEENHKRRIGQMDNIE